MKRIKEGKLEKDQGRRLRGSPPPGARLLEGKCEANFSYDYEQLEEKKRAQRRKNLSKKQREGTGSLGARRNQREATGGNGKPLGQKEPAGGNRSNGKATGGNGKPLGQKEPAGGHGSNWRQ